MQYNIKHSLHPERCQMNTDIYRNSSFLPNEIEFFEMIENVLGFKLYFWQKTFLLTGQFRQGGFTTAKCLRKLFRNVPIDFSDPPKSAKEHFERKQLIEIKMRFDNAGITTAPVFTCKKEKEKYYGTYARYLYCDEIYTIDAFKQMQEDRND